jgi:hypothetical protein
VSSWRNRGSIPEDEVLDKLAELTGLPVEKVYFAAYADKIHNPLVAKLMREQSHLSA